MADDSKITFLVKSSSGDKPYSIYVDIKDNKMFVFCNCPAGKFKKFCKHKIRLLLGDFDILYDEQDDDLIRVTDLIQGSDFQDLIFERSKAEKVLKEAQSTANKVKRKIIRAMENGIYLE